MKRARGKGGERRESPVLRVNEPYKRHVCAQRTGANAKNPLVVFYLSTDVVVPRRAGLLHKEHSPKEKYVIIKKGSRGSRLQPGCH
jgi:hypothetical protein